MIATLLALLLAAPPVHSDDAHVAEALAQAGGNRPELERVLARFADDARKLAAARFLIANMPGHGCVITRLADEQGVTVAYDPLTYPDFETALRALEALEEEHGPLDFRRDRFVPDVETIGADFLVAHIDRAFAAWERVPEGERVDFETFLEHVLPYRGSEEPVEDWLGPLGERLGDAWSKGGREAVLRRVRAEVKDLLRFNERYYLHPTDQGFSEMLQSGQGRCEDITNLESWAMRAVGIATAADYTPWWAHSDNNHAWTVMLDAQGRGCEKSNAHAAKVYRKTYAIQRDALKFRLPAGRAAPNRFLASEFAVDVTDQYGPTTDVMVDLDAQAAGEERFAYLCVFNGGEWRAITWSAVEDGRAMFDRVGRNALYLPAVHDGERLVPVAAPLLLLRDGTVQPLPGEADGAQVWLTALRPGRKSPDTGETTPASFLEAGKAYELLRWGGAAGWVGLEEFAATADAHRAALPASDGLYWLVGKDSRRLERPFVVEAGRQRWW